MQDINQAFDNSFYELESSYNLTKDSSKYSVIYTDGNYKDSTLGIDDYDYKVMGLLYMKEKEGTEYGSKYGYTVGLLDLNLTLMMVVQKKIILIESRSTQS